MRACKMPCQASSKLLLGEHLVFILKKERKKRWEEDGGMKWKYFVINYCREWLVLM